MVVENVDNEEENIVSDIDDRTLEEVIQDSQDDETQASESSRPCHECKGIDRFVSYKGKFSKHQVTFEDEVYMQMEQCHNISEDIKLACENIENYNPMYAPIIARVISDIYMAVCDKSTSFHNNIH